MSDVTPHVVDWHLMGAPEPLNLFAVNLLRSSPAFGGAQHDHWPTWPLRHGILRAGSVLDGANAIQNVVQRPGHEPMHRGGVTALDEEQLVSVTEKEISKLVITQSAKYSRVGDFIFV